MIRFLFSKYWPSCLVVALILYATLAPDPIGAEELPSVPHLDKLIHAIMMGGLFGAIVFDRQRSDRSRSVTKRELYWIAVFVMLFGAVDETVQGLMGLGRSGDIMDLIADWIGTWVAFLVAPPAIRRVLKIGTEP